MNQLEIFENRDSSTPWQTNLQAALLGYSSMESSVAETETLAQFNNTPHVNTEIQSLSEHIQRMNYSRLVQNPQTTKNFGQSGTVSNPSSDRPDSVYPKSPKYLES